MPIDHTGYDCLLLSIEKAHADLPCTFRACLGFSHVALT